MYSTWIERLKVDADELNRKLTNLRVFSESVGWDALSEYQKASLSRQEGAMADLLLIMYQRILDVSTN